MTAIFITGGAGYIGTHTCIALLNAGYEVVIFDNYINSHPEVLNRIQQITQRRITCIEGDIRDKEALVKALQASGCSAVIHCAGLKAVGESVTNPLNYYENNVIGTYNLLLAMQKTHLSTLVFSSSATVYGAPQWLPITESHPLSATNPYGRTKLIIEEMLRDQFRAFPGWKIAILRYFNPVGAHESGLIGEDPRGTPNNLMPYIAQVAAGKREKLHIWGNDYPTKDGTGVRDYIHVVDLAQAHSKALEYLSTDQCIAVNLGTGQGYSVLQVMHAFEIASNHPIAHTFCPRRDGDVASCYTNPSYAEKLLGWRATRNMAAMCEDHWRWQYHNPTGYT